MEKEQILNIGFSTLWVSCGIFTISRAMGHYDLGQLPILIAGCGSIVLGVLWPIKVNSKQV